VLATGVQSPPRRNPPGQNWVFPDDTAYPATYSFLGLKLTQAPAVNECSSCWIQHNKDMRNRLFYK